MQMPPALVFETGYPPEPGTYYGVYQAGWPAYRIGLLGKPFSYMLGSHPRCQLIPKSLL